MNPGYARAGVAGLIASATMLAIAGFAAGDPAPPPTAQSGAGMTISVEVRSPILGELTITPPTGTDTTAITVTTSAGCATPSDRFSVRLHGPGAFASGVEVVEPTSVGFSTTTPITAPLQKTLAEAATALNTSLVVGTYQLVLVCLYPAEDKAPVKYKASGMFVGSLYLTSPTRYQTTPPPPTTPPTVTPTTTAAAPAPGGPGSGGGGGGGLPYTGVAVGALVLIGLALAGAGIAFVSAARRRSVPGLTEES